MPRSWFPSSWVPSWLAPSARMLGYTPPSIRLASPGVSPPTRPPLLSTSITPPKTPFGRDSAPSAVRPITFPATTAPAVSLSATPRTAVAGHDVRADAHSRRRALEGDALLVAQDRAAVRREADEVALDERVRACGVDADAVAADDVAGAGAGPADAGAGGVGGRDDADVVADRAGRVGPQADGVALDHRPGRAEPDPHPEVLEAADEVAGARRGPADRRVDGVGDEDPVVARRREPGEARRGRPDAVAGDDRAGRAHRADRLDADRAVLPGDAGDDVPVAGSRAADRGADRAQEVDAGEAVGLRRGAGRVRAHAVAADDGALALEDDDAVDVAAHDVVLDDQVAGVRDVHAAGARAADRVALDDGSDGRVDHCDAGPVADDDVPVTGGWPADDDARARDGPDAVERVAGRGPRAAPADPRAAQGEAAAREHEDAVGAVGDADARDRDVRLARAGLQAGSDRRVGAVQLHVRHAAGPRRGHRGAGRQHGQLRRPDGDRAPAARVEDDVVGPAGSLRGRDRFPERACAAVRRRRRRGSSPRRRRQERSQRPAAPRPRTSVS